MITTCCPCDFFTTATLSSLRLNCFMLVDFTVCIQRMKYRTSRLAYIPPHRLDNDLDCGLIYVRHNSTLVHSGTEWAILRVTCEPRQCRESTRQLGTRQCSHKKNVGSTPQLRTPQSAVRSQQFSHSNVAMVLYAQLYSTVALF